jgi:sugar O-acyltransferase (sialic acid O-acetyltransferase NeuD family)
MAKVIIFGNTLSADLAHYYLTNDSEHEVVAYAVHEAYINTPPEPEAIRPDIPIVAFENIEKNYPPSDYKFFAPLTEKNMNRFREQVYNEIKVKGYEMISYISSKATVLTNKIGDNCFILEDNTIQPFVTIGNNCVLWSGNHIGHHGTIGNHVFFTSHVVLSGRCKVGDYCFFGVNATIRDKSTIGEGTLVAMGANITKQKTEPWSIWKGNPAEPAKISSKDIKI